jgi:hypothetical protein
MHARDGESVITADIFLNCNNLNAIYNIMGYGYCQM